MLKIISLLAFFASSKALYDSITSVIPLTASNFDNLVLLADEIWIVNFYHPNCSKSQALVPEYEKTANALKGLIKIGAINTHKQQELAERYEIEESPTIRIFAGNKANPTTYKGDKTAKGFALAALKAAKAQVKPKLVEQETPSAVIKLTDDNFQERVLQSDDMWLVEFYRPLCRHCKKLAPEWKKAAEKLKGKAQFGALDGTIQLKQTEKHNINGYPTIKFFPPGKKTIEDAIIYDGPRSSDGIVLWVLEKLADYAPPPEIIELTGPRIFKQYCEGKPLCIIAFLPKFIDCPNKCRNEYLKILQEPGVKYKNKLWGWFWTEAESQKHMENLFDLGGELGYPALTAVNEKKHKFLTMRGSFSKEGIDDFLSELIQGRGKANSYFEDALHIIENEQEVEEIPHLGVKNEL